MKTLSLIVALLVCNVLGASMVESLPSASSTLAADSIELSKSDLDFVTTIQSNTNTSVPSPSSNAAMALLAGALFTLLIVNRRARPSGN